jgi:methylenetetrahydrofolate dehydrogenase (NADP+)/methenyltetrahydrofolate cyclohydrolase
VTTVIDGKQVAASVIETVKSANAALEAAKGVRTGLAVIIVGDDPASHTYVSSKSRMAKECGFKSVQHTLPVETSQEELAALVATLNADPSIHGILVQLPLPRHLDSEAIIQSILPEKDVDGLSVVNAGKLATGDLKTGLVSCTPAGAMVFVRRTHGEDLSGLNATVIGRSNLFGKPMAQLLLNANATVTIAHSRTKDLAGICRNAAPERGEGKTRLVGDVAFAEVSPVAAVITPVPGGVGPMTIAMLMANTVIAAHRSAGLTPPVF